MPQYNFPLKKFITPVVFQENNEKKNEKPIFMVKFKITCL